MAEGETVFTFKANTKPAEESLDAFGDKVNLVAQKAGKALATYFSFRVLINGFEKAIDSAMEAEQAVRQFNSALASTGTYSEEASASFENYAATLERTTGVADDLIISNAALLVSIGRLEGEGLKRATQAALDLSRGLQIDVSSAFDVVTKATQGNLGILAKYGLEVKSAKTDAEKFAAALQFIETRFSGLAQGNVNTFQGALSKVKNGFNDIFESIGKVITKDPKAIASLSVLGDIFYKISANIAASNTGLSTFIDYTFKIGKFLTDFLLVPLESIARFLVTTMLMIPRMMIDIYSSLSGVADKLMGTDLQGIIKPLRDGLVSLQEAAMAPMVSDEQLFSTRLSKGIVDAKNKIDELAKKIKTDLPNDIKPPPEVESAWDQFFAGFKDGLDNMSKSLKQLGSTVAGTFVNGLGNAFNAVGKALVSGQNAFQAFGSAILMMLGNIAMQMGNFYIAAGAAAFFLNPGSGLGMILAGGALTVLGGVLQALGTGGGVPAAGNAVGAPGTSPSNPLFTSPMTEQTPEEARAQAQTGVQVVVQGNIFDSRETGLQIAQIINDSFDLNGTIIRANA